jgi:hypothetical protein
MVQLQHLDEVVSKNTSENKSETNAEIVNDKLDDHDDLDEQMVVEYLEEIPSECESMENEEIREPKPTDDGQKCNVSYIETY